MKVTVAETTRRRKFVPRRTVKIEKITPQAYYQDDEKLFVYGRAAGGDLQGSPQVRVVLKHPYMAPGTIHVKSWKNSRQLPNGEQTNWFLLGIEEPEERKNTIAALKKAVESGSLRRVQVRREPEPEQEEEMDAEPDEEVEAEAPEAEAVPEVPEVQPQ